MKEYETRRQGRVSSLSGLIATKQSKNDEFVRLRTMVDSLISFSFQGQQTNAGRQKKASPKIQISQQTIKKDTIAVFSGKQKRKLMKRIMDAIRDKDTTSKTVLSTSNSTVITGDSALAPLQAAADIANISVLEKARMQLSATERELLAVNGRIFTNLQVALMQLKQSEETQARALRAALLTTTSAKFEEINLLIWGSVLLVALLAAMIISNLVKLYKKDVTVTRYAQMTAISTKKKGELMAHLTHEIRTPLNSIIGFSQLMDSRELDEDLRTNVDAIKSSSKILLMLVNEILDFSKFETGKIKLQNKPFKVTALIGDAVSMLSVLANEKKIALSAHFEAGPEKYLNGDEVRIKQVVINLLTNAVKFTPNGGTVTVSTALKETSHQKNSLQIKVKDSGIGIESKDLNSIFEDYMQVESNDDRPVQVGTGLGLSICKRIVDLYKGQIKVESTPGKGSEFTVSLPLEIAEYLIEPLPSSAPAAFSAAVAIAPTPVLPDAILNGKKVLVVDDSKINLLLLSKILEKLGATYDLSNDGQKAIDLFDENTYDLVITDIHMPVMDGVELTKRIRAHSASAKSGIPIIGFTGSTEEENVARYKQAGIDEIIPKPVELVYLANVIKQQFMARNLVVD
ncbi:ATP-binding protein [Dyadobacter alkalitolerans]|uniref:ATP-binding protein n=1 Tax=Dyadobacter alkalitolerans TaxID=492736 RepID=UPI00146FC2E4|nr:ATP-binding protein [Dyadobacter alkalitolerans]